MDLLSFRDYVLNLPEVQEWEFPGGEAVIYKIGEKWFAAVSLTRGNVIALKCNPALASALREKYPQITPAWHFNKRHWNDIDLSHPLPEDLVKRLVQHSYILTISKNVSPASLRGALLKAASRAEICGDPPVIEDN